MMARPTQPRQPCPAAPAELAAVAVGCAVAQVIAVQHSRCLIEAPQVLRSRGCMEGAAKVCMLPHCHAATILALAK